MKSSFFATVIMAMALLIAACSGCSNSLGDDHIDLMDSVDGTAIVSAEDLIEFLENGTTSTATLLISVDLGEEMISLCAGRGPVVLEGNDCTISGGGDCVIRMEDGAKLTFNDATIIGKSDVIGCLGDAEIGGANTRIEGGLNAVLAAGKVMVAEGSGLELVAQEGSGIHAKGITLCKNSVVRASGKMNAVHTTKNDLVLEQGASLEASTQENYNAVKCSAALVLSDGSRFSAVNHGAYHGAEVESLQVDGHVTINAKGGQQGMGMFIFSQVEDICVIGSCEPAAQFENGLGSITFVKDIAEYEEWLAQQQAAQAAESGGSAGGVDDVEGEE